MRPAAPQQVGEMDVDVLVFLRRGRGDELARDIEFRAATAECELQAICGLDVDVPALLAGLPPVEVGGEFGFAIP